MTNVNQESDKNTNELIVKYLESFITTERLKKINQVLSYRTRHLTVVLEDIYQSQNASAVLRSCDIFGVQDVHIIENINKYEINPDVALGATKWLNLIQYNNLNNNTERCLSYLKKQNYRIVAASPHDENYLLEELPIDNKTALVFGTEMHGLSDIATEMADGFVKIPMYGFTESFNISVSAAICLYHLTGKLRVNQQKYQLTQDEKTEIKLFWLKNSIKNAQLLIDRFLKDNKV